MSRTTQRLMGGKIEKVWAGVTAFLATCTTASIHEPTSVDLTAYSAWQDDEQPVIANRIIAETKAIFGHVEGVPVSFHYPSGIPSDQTKHEWRLDKSDLAKAVAYLSAGQPWPKFVLGPVELIVTYDFKLVQPTTNIDLPDQEHGSRLIVWLSRSCSCSPELYFPFHTATKEFSDYLSEIATHLPFKLDPKYLRLARPNKKGTAYVHSRIKPH